MESTYFFIIPSISFIIGIALTALYFKNAMSYASTKEKDLQNQLSTLQNQFHTLESETQNLSIQLAQISTKYETVVSDLQNENKLNFNLKDENQEQSNTIHRQLIEINSLQNKIDTLHEKLLTQKDEIEVARKQSLLEFEALANKILEEKTHKFTLTNQEKMEQILNPLKENISEFKKKVEDTYDRESKERFTLESKIKELVQLNNQISKDANNLTNALKGQAKTQGNWGEMILESILQHSGLEKNREYFVQQAFTDEVGARKQPDVIVKYPDNRQIIIDSKVSLVAYEKYVNENDDDIRHVHLNAHYQSVKSHIDNLSSKNYESLQNTPDFVMMFIPIEPAFIAVMHSDQELWSYAYKKRIVLISPTNLIAALKMISDIWKRELQSRNSLAIAAQGSALYDKFVGFLSDMESIGDQLLKTTNTYEAAFGKLKKGKGNLISQVEKLKKLGLNTKKSLPDDYLEDMDISELSE